MRTSTILAGLAAFVSSYSAAAAPSPDYFILKSKPHSGQTLKPYLKNLVVAAADGGTASLQYPILYPKKEEQDQFFQLVPSHQNYSNLAFTNTKYDNGLSYFDMTSLNLPDVAWQTIGARQVNDSKYLPTKGNFYFGSSGLLWSSDTSNSLNNEFGGWYGE